MKSEPMPCSATAPHANAWTLSVCFAASPARRRFPSFVVAHACVASIPARAVELEETLMNGALRRRTVLAKPCWPRTRPGVVRSTANRVVEASLRLARAASFSAILLRIARVGLATAAVFMLTSIHLAQAQDESAKTKPANAAQAPLPPVRPTNLPPAPPPNVPVPQQEPSAKDSRTRDPSAGDPSSNLSPYRLHTLPPAPRARMHECGIEWQRMKAAGATTEETWYAFAQTCLAR
jgi:hypothetical protein